jgi:hypothetical protein
MRRKAFLIDMFDHSLTCESFYYGTLSRCPPSETTFIIITVILDPGSGFRVNRKHQLRISSQIVKKTVLTKLRLSTDITVPSKEKSTIYSEPDEAKF